MNRKAGLVGFTHIAVFALVALVIAGCGGSHKSTTSTTTTPAPAVTAFTASASNISPGDSVTLTWTQSNVTTVTIDNGVGTVQGTSVTVKPTATTTYTVTASNSTGTATKKVTVTVVPVPAIASFSAADPVLTPATKGLASTTLSWNVTGASTVTIDNGVGTVTGTSVSVSPSATTTYTVTAANSLGNANGTVTETVTVKVRNNLAVLNGTPFAGTGRSDYFNSWYLCSSPYFLATDAKGNIYTTDSDSEAVCKITPSGNVTVLANNAGMGNYYYGDTLRNAPLKMSPAAVRSTAAKTAARRGLASGSVNLGASGPGTFLGIEPRGIAVSSDGNTIYFSDDNYDVIRKISIGSDGTPTTSIVSIKDDSGNIVQLHYPEALALDAAGNLYMADRDNYIVLKLTFAADGSATASTLAGNGTYGHNDGAAASAEFGYIEGLAVSSDGNSVYLTEESASYDIRKLSIDAKGVITVSTLAGGPWGFADGSGDVAKFTDLGQLSLSADGTTLYVTDYYNRAVRQIVMATDGTVTVSTIAGHNQLNVEGEWNNLADGKALLAWFDGPWGLAADANGNVYIASDEWTDMSLRKLNLSTSQVSTVVLNIYGNTGGSADGAGSKAAFSFMQGSSLVTDSKGNIYVSDTGNNTIRMITTDKDGNSVVSTLAGVPAMYGHDDGTGSEALFAWPEGLALNADGSALFVADYRNNTIRNIDLASGAVKTVAGDPLQMNSNLWPFENPQVLAFGPDGLLYFTAWFYGFEDEGSQYGIGTLDLNTGQIQMLKATDLTSGLFTYRVISGLGFYTSSDKSKIYLYASGGCAVFKIDLSPAPATQPSPADTGTPAGPAITTLAGSRVCGYQDGPATAALFNQTHGLAVDSLGNVYVGDVDNSVVRRISSDGNVTTVVGSYPSATTTLGPLPGSIYGPANFTIDSTDNLLIAVPNAVLTLVP